MPLNNSTKPNSGLLVIPALNEGFRLPIFLPYLMQVVAASGHLRVVVVDDGSAEAHCDKMRSCIEELRKSYSMLEPLLSITHAGKGAAIRAGWELKRDEDWLGFVDADGAVSAGEVMRLWGVCSEDATSSMIIAVRTGEEKTQVKRHWYRWVLSRAFNFIIRRALATNCADTQCGLKWLRRNVYEELSGDLKEKGIFLDLELMQKIRARNEQVREIAIHWQEVAGSKMGLT